MRIASISLFSILAMSSLAGSLYAQSVSTPLWTGENIESKVLGETRVLKISLPQDYDAREYAAERYPVLIVLDAQWDVPFTAAVANARALAWPGTNAPAIPGLIIVGIETPDRTRFRDMTLSPVGDAAKQINGAGGGATFLRFLATELLPYIASRYRTQSTTILAGHSLTGAFAAWAFGQAPDLFTGVIDTWLNTDGFAGRQVVDGLRSRSKSGRLFVTNGAAELGMDSGIKSFIEAVRARPAPAWALEYQRLDEVSHSHTQTLGMIPGLRYVFRPVSLAGYQIEFDGDEPVLAKFNKVFDSIREKYLRGARDLGLPERLPLSFLLGQSRRYQGLTMAPLRLRLCDEITTSYPKLWHGYDCAGDAQALLGRGTEAVKNYRRAADVARDAGDVNADRLLRKAEKP
ncbi:MAG: alpha/beta hydrolase-fold protein [bacterium]|nr:alpha/beta hydrolase-fold protein [bacterium]